MLVKPQTQAFLDYKGQLLGSLLYFTQVFFKLRTGRDFELSDPTSRESHFITICRELTQVFYQKTLALMINIPPRYGKTELFIHFIAWSLAHYPDCNFIYITYSHTLAKKQTQTVKEIITLPQYKQMFDVHIKKDTSAKDNFETTAGGSVYAVGAGGSITGKGAGIKGAKRFGGALLFDDIIKPEDALSDTIREARNEWYFNTAQSRVNDPNTAQMGIAQRTHEHDLPAVLIEKGWQSLVLPALDGVGHALYPQMHSHQQLRKMEQENPYVFAAQYQQNPQPAGGGIFKPEWFVLLDETPEILTTFITADTAETDKDYNDASVFSFWGIYKIQQDYIETDLWGLHWIDCVEIRVEPSDLETNFTQFYAGCMRHPVKPKLAIIEKKSTGVTLASVLKNKRGLQILDIERTKASGSKIARYFEIQPYIASKQVSLMKYDKHTELCLTHCRKISANNSHLHDDIADTLYDAVKVSLIDELVQRSFLSQSPSSKNVLKAAHARMQQLNQARARVYR